jgi:hypothetical protein
MALETAHPDLQDPALAVPHFRPEMLADRLECLSVVGSWKVA